MKKIGLFGGRCSVRHRRDPRESCGDSCRVIGESRLFWRLFFFPMEGNRKYEMYYSP